MSNARLEAFSDGVFAFALTLLIVDVRLRDTEGIGSTGELWRALAHLAPVVFAFLLSFAIVLVTWVNHHGLLRLLQRSSAAFMYANGFLLLTVVFIPFPTALLGDFIGTDHAAPAVVLYNGVLAVQAIAWLLVCGAALRGDLARDAVARETLRQNRNRAWPALALYAALAIAALWLPVAVAVVTTASWVTWLLLSIRMKHA